MGQINRQDFNRHFAYRGLPNQQRTFPRKMVRPTICPGIKQWDETALQVSRDVKPFVRIAPFTAQREIIGHRQTAVFFSNNRRRGNGIWRRVKVLFIQ